MGLHMRAYPSRRIKLSVDIIAAYDSSSTLPYADAPSPYDTLGIEQLRRCLQELERSEQACTQTGMSFPAALMS